jgi:LmbE family N-acetylglucosaminyl deacetylase
MARSITKSVAIIVAHPDDETLWAGGTILSHPLWNCYVVCLSRKKDNDRAPRFFKSLEILNSEGSMGDLNDGPEQKPLEDNETEEAILDLLPSTRFDLIISHNPSGEYTRHLRHEETGKAVLRLWKLGMLRSGRLWSFAYEDNNAEYYPRAVVTASVYKPLTKHIWKRKYCIITETYGFEKGSFEAQTTPKAEAFWQLPV